MASGTGLVAAGLLMLYTVLLYRSMFGSRANRSRRTHVLIDPMIEFLTWTGLFERLQPWLHRQRMALAHLERGFCPPERLLRWTAEGIGMTYVGLVLGWLLAFVSGNLSVAWVCSVIAGCIPVLRARDLHRQAERRRQAVSMELPVLLSRLLVMVNAGENVMRALLRSAEKHPAKGHPLYDELHAALAAIQRGESMSLALEEFGRRCAVPEAKLFAATVLMNAKRGGDEFVPALRDMTRQLWEKRKSAARTLGEQASSRLAFPLAIVFLLIVVLVGAPALLMM